MGVFIVTKPGGAKGREFEAKCDMAEKSGKENRDEEGPIEDVEVSIVISKDRLDLWAKNHRPPKE
jgi:hypothetical protein